MFGFSFDFPEPISGVRMWQVLNRIYEYPDDPVLRSMETLVLGPGSRAASEVRNVDKSFEMPCVLGLEGQGSWWERGPG